MTNNGDVKTLNATEVQDWEKILERESGIAPLVDIYETEDDFILKANMPGVSKEDVKLKLEEGSLSIFGKVNYDEIANRKYILNENELGHYYRRFRISNSIDDSRVEAGFENGQLTIKLPKHDRIKPRTITVK